MTNSRHDELRDTLKRDLRLRQSPMGVKVDMLFDDVLEVVEPLINKKVAEAKADIRTALEENVVFLQDEIDNGQWEVVEAVPMSAINKLLGDSE